MAKSVVILSSVAANNVDAYVKSGIYETAALENGNVVVPGDKSDTSGYGDVYEVSLPATASLDSDIFYMVYEAPVPVVDGKYKGITDDPREFEIPKETVFNMYKPQVGDEIVITDDGIAGTKSANTFVVPADDTGELTWSADADGITLGYKLKGTTFVTVGSDRVVAYKFTCEKA